MAFLKPLLPHLTPEEKEIILQGGGKHPELRKRLAAQHPLHEIFSMAFDNLGGVEHLTAWGATEPDKFYSILARMAPAPKENRHSGEVKITVDSQLQPGALDAPPIEGEFTHE